MCDPRLISSQAYAACGTPKLPALPDSFDADVKVLAVHGIRFDVVKYLGPSAEVEHSGPSDDDLELVQQCQEFCSAVDDFVLGSKQVQTHRESENIDVFIVLITR